ncbi:MAG: hypothetical protein ACAI44_06270 [Candidatus Sericytochromatia bacterium]
MSKLRKLAAGLIFCGLLLQAAGPAPLYGVWDLTIMTGNDRTETYTAYLLQEGPDRLRGKLVHRGSCALLQGTIKPFRSAAEGDGFSFRLQTPAKDSWTGSLFGSGGKSYVIPGHSVRVQAGLRSLFGGKARVSPATAADIKRALSCP